MVHLTHSQLSVSIDQVGCVAENPGAEDAARYIPLYHILKSCLMTTRHRANVRESQRFIQWNSLRGQQGIAYRGGEYRAGLPPSGRWSSKPSPRSQRTQFPPPTSTRRDSLDTSNNPKQGWPWPKGCAKEACPCASSLSGLRVPEAQRVTPSPNIP